ncbi:GGDEF domain-containing protein [Luteimonas sp. BDR2-5]|uniref:sensor domain-containing diguanylate cyclase n=1 Tax=Proluteimonas luteida TaxID=2878685 RepID=UPI001E431FF2|nr:GGDEF domain-containing protein [Luteimonas sp. BDR2-5]MCD9026933.1 GGDEF domain-containing protein [Luteimonas sp. BDR2-5]
MGIGGRTHTRGHWWWLLLVLAAWPACVYPSHPGAPGRIPLELARLAADPPADEVVAGLHDAGLVPQASSDVLFETARTPGWWRIGAGTDIAAQGDPHLVLETPHSTRVQAWLPGADTPTEHALHGAAADPRFARRALAIALPGGLQAGQAVWLRVDAPAGYPMPLSIATRDRIHRDDLRHVAWRTTILATMLVLALLALGFWYGSNDRSYAWLAGMLGFGALYLAAIGGEAEHLPGIGPWLAESVRGPRLMAFAALVCSNLFQQRYLDLPRKLPLLSRTLTAVTWLVVALAVVALLSTAPLVALLGNLLLLASAVLVLAAGLQLAWRGDRQALLLFLSWLPLAVFAAFRAMELSSAGAGAGPAWLGQGLAASFALAGLVLTFGMTEKLIELRRDRDLASARADLDALTLLASRPAIERELRKAVAQAHAQGEALSVAFIDIDHFKTINDAHGHPVGDQCLHYICRRVRNRIRAQDLLGRYGGDELLLVMPRADIDDAITTAMRIRAAVNCRPVTVEAHSLDCSLSIGVATLLPGEDAEALLLRADSALYASKRDGRDRVSADPRPDSPRAIA